MAPKPPGRRNAILRLLRNSAQPCSILQLAEQVQVHPNTVRFHLEGLLRAGQVEQVPADAVGPGRPPVLFRATRRMDPGGPTNYRLLATMLTDQLAASSPDPASAAVEIGRSWGPTLIAAETTHKSRSAPARRSSALAQLEVTLSALGFAPDPPAGPRATTIRLRHCPFLDLTDGPTDAAKAGYRTVVCSLHLGLMQGALAALNGSVTVTRLDPFVEPDLCVAHLAAPTAQMKSGAAELFARVRAGNEAPR